MEEKANTTESSWEHILNMVSELTQQNIDLSAELKKYHDGWATEVIKQQKASFKWWRRFTIALLIGLLATNAYWIHVFQSYEYVSQDGNGINSINSGTQGDVINEPTGED